MCVWQSMYKDISFLLARYLYIADIVSLRLTCKRFNYLFGPSHKGLWRMLFMRDYQYEPCKSKTKRDTFKRRKFRDIPYTFYKNKHIDYSQRTCTAIKSRYHWERWSSLECYEYDKCSMAWTWRTHTLKEEKIRLNLGGHPVKELIWINDCPEDETECIWSNFTTGVSSE